MRAWIGRFSVVLCGLPVAWADVNGLAGPYTIGAFIRAPNLSDLVKRTLAVSDPKSELYGSYYSQDRSAPSATLRHVVPAPASPRTVAVHV